MTRDEALKKMQAVKSYMTSGNPIWSVTEIGEAFDMAIEALEQPEIIRCKDCKFWTHIKRTNRYWCKTDDGLFDLNPSPDDFCSRGERRTDEINRCGCDDETSKGVGY